MTRKSMLAAAIVFLGLAFHSGTSAQSPVAPTGSSEVGAISGAPVTPATVGWYYGHATYCNAYWDGIDTYQYLYTPENGWWWIKVTNPNVLAFSNQMTTACQTGNWVAFYVYNTAGSWNQMYTYTYK